MNIFLFGQCTLHWGRMEFGNIGNYYIIEPFIRELHRVFGKNTLIRTTFQLSDRFCNTENIQVVPMDLYYGWNDNDLSNALEELAIAEFYNKHGYLIKKTPFINEIIDSDLVIDFSGDIWGDNADFLGKDRFLVGLIKDRIAQLFHKKTVMLAGSPGPFHNQKVIEFAKEVYRNFDLVTNREPISRKVLVDSGFDVSNTLDVACPSFLFEPSSIGSIQSVINDYHLNENGRPKVGFILCGWNFEEAPYDKWPREDKEYEVFVPAIKFLISDLGTDVYLMSHSNGFPIPPKEFVLQHGRDYPVIKQLQKVLINNGIEENLYALDGVYDAWDTKAIIKQFDFLVSGRVHGAIAGLSQTVPTVIIDYGHEPKAHKLKGFARVAGVEEYIADPLIIKDMISKIDRCFNHLSEIKKTLEEQIPVVQATARAGFDVLLKICGKE